MIIPVFRSTERGLCPGYGTQRSEAQDPFRSALKGKADQVFGGPESHRVEMRYRSRPTDLGIGLSLAGLALASWLLVGARRKGGPTPAP